MLEFKFIYSLNPKVMSYTNYSKNTQSLQSKPAANTKDLRHISDNQLYSMAKHFGKNALLWRQKFIGLLPEINRRRLYEKHNHISIFVFAKKLAGLSEEQVRRTLNLEKRFTNTPALKKILVNGEASINKLARVASIATSQNDTELANAVQTLPKSAIETLVRDEKSAQSQNGLHKPKNEVESVPGHRLENDLELSEEVSEKLLELQNKGIDVNEVLLELLQKREEKIEEEKEAIAKGLRPKESRHIPVKVKRIVRKEHGTKCCISGCQKDAAVLHHSRPFALSKTHDPRFLAPLCKEHHAIAHSINLKVQEKRKL